MTNVLLGRAGSDVLVDLRFCVKTGQVTSDRVTLRGHTTPAWVTLLLVISIVGFLFVAGMTSRRYRVTLPFTRSAHDRWRSNRRLGWLVGLGGVAALIAAATIGAGYAGLLLGGGIALLAGSAVIGTANAITNNVGIHVTRDGDLLLTRAHPVFADAARTAVIEPLAPR